MRAVKVSLVLAVLVATPMFAQTATSNLDVSATVVANCTIATTPVAFGAYDPIAANSGAAAHLDSTGTVDVACTKGTPGLRIDLGTGANAGGALSTTRAMTAGAGLFLDYDLYSDNGHTTLWGSGAGSGVTLTAPANKNVRSTTVYGRVPGAQDVSAGSYNDTVVATINF
ncbi:MAG TPA: spore coat U domain-containing protein [Thermoanaerobaculia bacterium]|nr:spore coat U domain-containing protein [Thermoanaerobaculia bacterium]